MERKKLTSEIRKEIINSTLEKLKGYEYWLAKDMVETIGKALGDRSIVC